ncbi:transposase [Actinomyces ruminicola]|uniref:Transposase and inactivated derivatives n=1 Tax=Actinomyces ruminicola TaxID=332524 RepID=A0A1H0AG15_9ACTO|nr:transposase [Actinomyces ruminicola]SDN31953.1 Transposase and inactivated derivatives [Actinomyces ruminicola]
MTKAKYSEEFREQVAREVVEGDRSIASVAASYGLVAQTVGNWVAKYRKQHGVEQERRSESEAQELARMKAENYKLRMENEFLKKAAAFFAKEQP